MQLSTAQHALFPTLLGLGLAGAIAAAPLAAETRLMMVEQPGCIWCARWQEEVGPVYPLTEEGKRAPILVQQLRDDLPEGVTVDRPFTFTPTFVLLVDGVEQARIEGYPGEDFFWGLLGRMLDEAPQPMETGL